MRSTRRNPVMRAVGCALLVLVLQAGPAVAGGAGEPAMRTTIERQLMAFRSGDAETAYAQASPHIRSIFPTSGIFMGMVKAGYAALIRPQGVTFLGLVPDTLPPVYRVLVEGRDGRRWLALYQMSQQPGGAWLIGGCTLVRLAGEST